MKSVDVMAIINRILSDEENKINAALVILEDGTRLIGYFPEQNILLSANCITMILDADGQIDGDAVAEIDISKISAIIRVEK